MGLLSAMAVGSEQRLVAARAAVSEPELRARCAAMPPAPRLQLADAGFDLIAELKLRSPALGDLSTRRHWIPSPGCAATRKPVRRSARS